MKELNRSLGTTFVIATHSSELAAEASRLVRMLDGRVQSNEAAA